MAWRCVERLGEQPRLAREADERRRSPAEEADERLERGAHGGAAVGPLHRAGGVEEHGEVERRAGAAAGVAGTRTAIRTRLRCCANGCAACSTRQETARRRPARDRRSRRRCRIPPAGWRRFRQAAELSAASELEGGVAHVEGERGDRLLRALTLVGGGRLRGGLLGGAREGFIGAGAELVDWVDGVDEVDSVDVSGWSESRVAWPWPYMVAEGSGR